MKLPDSRLSTLITTGAIAIVVAGAVALMLIENVRLRDVYLSEQRARLEQSLHDEKLRLGQTINTLREDVLFLSNIPPVVGIMHAALSRSHDVRHSDTREQWEERLQQIFSALSAVHPDYYQIRYIGVADGGRELVRVDNRAGKIEITPPARLQAKGDRDYFKAVMGLRVGEVYLSEFNLNREWGAIEQPYRPTLRAATPVFAPSGQIFGMVVVNLDVSRLLASAASGLPAGVQAYITNMGGECLLHPDMRRSFGFELGSKEKIITDFPLLETIFNPLASEHFPLQAIAANAGAQYLAAERIHFDPGNPARFLLLTYHLPTAAAAQQIATIPARHIVGGFIAILLVSGIALFVLRRIFAPLEQLTVAAGKIAAGNHDVPLPQNGSGEIRRLANTFGAMLAKLSQREQEILLANGELEKRVKERTIELELARQEAELLLRRNQILMATSMDGIHVMDMQGSLLIVNDAFCRMLGYSQEEAIRLNVGDWDAQLPIDELRAAFREMVGKSATIETLWRCKDGILINVEINASGVRLEGQDFIYVSGRDITARKQVEEAKLRESDERFRGTLEQAAVGIAHASLDGYFCQVNQKFCAITGYARDELLRMNYQDITFSDDLDENVCYRQQLLAGEISTFSMEKRYMRKDRSVVWVNLTVSLLRDADGIPGYTIGVIEDITERRQAEALVQRFGSLLQSSFDEIYIFDAHTLHFLLTSEGAEKNLGYSFDELNQLILLDLCPSLTKEGFWQIIASLRSGERPTLFFETVLRRKNGTTYPVEMRMQFMESDSPVFMAVVQDVTERNYSERRLRDLSAHLQTVREEEKASVAREIHDDLGGTLTALKMDVYWLAEELSAHAGAASLLGHIEAMSQLLDNAVSVTRRVITDLRPTILDDLGLHAALEWQAEQFQKRTGIQCGVVGSFTGGCGNELDKAQTINLFRIFQESLTNVARHSGASGVEAELQCEDDEIILTISDNGCGLPEGHTVAATSYGMIGMRERAEQLGGRINFYSPPGGGFSVTVILPLLAGTLKEGKT